MPPVVTRHPSGGDRAGWRAPWTLRGVVALGCGAILFYFGWWLREAGARLTSPWLVLALLLAALYFATQVVARWVAYLAARRRPIPPVLAGPTIDVFVTAYREPHAMIERALAAACAMRGPHRTWLLDDGEEPALRALAQRLGAGYLTRPDRTDHKAGNVNAALARTDGEIVVTFDIDHVPDPAFLERTVGFFRDPAIGFVQVALTFANGEQSWVARAADEGGVDYYGATCLGMDGLGGATLVGSNALIRRAALESIGGYKPGLAEDLATSIALHAAGWRSAYVAEALAPGLVPFDLPGWFTQQFKWAHGSFDLLLTAYPRLFPRLTWGQRVCYAIRMTSYWHGLFVGVHLLVTLGVLLAADAAGRAAFAQYLLHLFPVTLLIVLVRQVAARHWPHPAPPAGAHWRGMVLVYASWPIFMLAWTLTLLRVPVAFRPTPKTPGGGVNPLWLLPQAASVVLIGGIVARSIAVPDARLPLPLLAFALLQTVPALCILRQWRQPAPRRAAHVGGLRDKPVGD